MRIKYNTTTKTSLMWDGQSEADWYKTLIGQTNTVYATYSLRPVWKVVCPRVQTLFMELFLKSKTPLLRDGEYLLLVVID
jgi:hypothetical protein